ncbi:unnamed protein product, partial [Musa banksii]
DPRHVEYGEHIHLVKHVVYKSEVIKVPILVKYQCTPDRPETNNKSWCHARVEPYHLILISIMWITLTLCCFIVFATLIQRKPTKTRIANIARCIEGLKLIAKRYFS